MSFEILDTFIKQAKIKTELSELDKLLQQALTQLDIHKFAYTHYSKNFKINRVIKYECSSDPLESWHQHYLEADYDCQDPIMTHAFQHMLPLAWDLNSEYRSAKPSTHTMFQDAMDFGLRFGISFPACDNQGNPSMLVCHCPTQHVQSQLQNSESYTIQLLGYYFNAFSNTLLNDDQENKNYHLTDREKECLQLTAQYKMAAEIAYLLGISVRTVGFHLENASKKLETHNKYQAVLKAMKLDIL